MDNDPYEGSGIAIRDDLRAAHRRALDFFSRPGTWLDAAKRLAVVAEARNAHDCAHCKDIKAALSPNAVKGDHASLGALSAAEVDVVHRIVMDPGRLSQGWARKNVDDGGIGEGPYVEIVGLVAMTMILDTFNRALGLPFRDLPAAAAGVPTRYTPPGAKVDAAWLPIVEPGDVSPGDGDLYLSPKVGYIQRALTMVPDTKRAYWDLAETHYLPAAKTYSFGENIRAVTRPQIEIIAARVSALHQCIY